MQGDYVSSGEYCRTTEETFGKAGCDQTMGDHEVQHKGTMKVSEWVSAVPYIPSSINGQ